MPQPAAWYKYLSDYDVGKLRKLMSVDVLRALIIFGLPFRRIIKAGKNIFIDNCIFGIRNPCFG